MKALSRDRVRSFQKKIRAFYRNQGRDLPWRQTQNSYHILVSEIMLQQTQVPRVVPKYVTFLQQFPTWEALAAAPLAAVLRAWQGLGYNRRARSLHLTAHAVVSHHGGRLPTSVGELQRLPGVGPYTARAVAVFAYSQPQVLLETNIRAVFLHDFLRRRMSVPDAVIAELVAHTLDRRNPRVWYWGLMDYGSYLKAQHVNPSRRSAHFRTQSPFATSNRRVRGLILKQLAKRSRTAAALHAHEWCAPEQLAHALQALVREGLIHQQDRSYWLGEAPGGAG